MQRILSATHGLAPKHLAKLLLICALAVAANFLAIQIRALHEVPLFIDTIFTVAVALALGVFPGIAVAVLTWVATGIQIGYFYPFVFVAIAEVLLVCWLKPISPKTQDWIRHNTHEGKTARLVIVSAQLLVLYIVCAIVASVLGGVIAYFYYTVLGRDVYTFWTAVNAFRRNFLQGGSPVFLADVFSRVQINIVDRFVAIFGGYFVSLAIVNFLKEGKQ